MTKNQKQKNDIETKELVKIVVKEYADLTNGNIESYFEKTNIAMQNMAVDISSMTKSVQKALNSQIKHEERYISQNERMERLDQSVRDQGIIQRNFESDISERMNNLSKEVNNNSFVRKAVVWLAGTLMAAMIGGGLLVNSLSNKFQLKKEVKHDTKEIKISK